MRRFAIAVCALSCAEVLDLGVLTETTDASVDANVAEASAPRYAARVLEDRPVAYFRLDDPDGVLRDVIDSGGGAYEGNFSLTDGAMSGSFGVKFEDGTATTQSIYDLSAFTIEAWILPDAFDAGEQTILSTGAWSFASTDNLVVRAGDASTTSAIVKQTSQWNHVAATFDGASVRIYLNGGLSGSTPVSIAGPHAALAIAKSALGNPFHGVIDEVALYDYALSAVQLTGHVQAAMK